MQKHTLTREELVAAALSKLKTRDIHAAGFACRELTQRFPKDPQSWLVSSHVAVAAGNPSKALEFVRRGLALEPGNPGLLLQQATCLQSLFRFGEAADVAVEAAEAGRESAPILNQVGFLLTTLERYNEALEVYSRAVALSPRDAQYLFNRATVRRFLGDLAGAETDYDEVLRLRPDDCEAYYNRSELRTQTAERNHVKALQTQIDAPQKTWQGSVHLYFALAKEYEDLGEYERSYAALDAGAKLRRKHLQYDVDRDVDTASTLIELFNGDACNRSAEGACEDEVIFILGMPRSGTTLLERMLSSHSQVVSAGELNDFALSLVAAVEHQEQRRGIPRQELIRGSMEIDFPALGFEYVRRARSRIGDARRFIDKLPMNYLYCGHIARSLPNARIIQLTRHPMAACFAVYKSLFKQGYPFSYDIAELARFYAAYTRLTDHWQDVLGDRVVRVAYEDLVSEPEANLRRVFAACGLPWESACLEFHNNPAASTTASAAQVRRPLYTSSIDKWRRYEAFLEPLKEALIEAGIPEAQLS